MIEKLSIFQLAGGLARHSAARQTVVARNLANMDSPGFKAQDIANFSDFLGNSSANKPGDGGLKTSRAGHIAVAEGQATYRAHEISGLEQKSNGNSVSLETETLRAIEAERAHSRALAIYQSSLTLLKTSIGRGR